MIWFNSKKAREHLIKNGIVISARKIRKSYGIQKVFYYDEKMNRKYLCIASVEFLEYSNIDEENNEDHKRVLSKYIENSGFNTVNEWVNEIKRLNSNRWMPENLIILKVVYIRK